MVNMTVHCRVEILQLALAVREHPAWIMHSQQSDLYYFAAEQVDDLLNNLPIKGLAGSNGRGIKPLFKRGSASPRDRTFSG